MLCVQNVLANDHNTTKNKKKKKCDGIYSMNSKRTYILNCAKLCAPDRSTVKICRRILSRSSYVSAVCVRFWYVCMCNRLTVEATYLSNVCAIKKSSVKTKNRYIFIYNNIRNKNWTGIKRKKRRTLCISALFERRISLAQSAKTI